ncbi:hypothetical protein BJ508DRAFT_322426 [Ascobolus immersus RN42]|uniref:Uncharacterized protein n=1 Tax=Ascobolus immersus RN42 TaxID=1160509 RepID=A0A3N4II65_ASCIM|nr:hypothetical protein BJ508DRAFT_322426 [Ascobolus immersus RN42]
MHVANTVIIGYLAILSTLSVALPTSGDSRAISSGIRGLRVQKPLLRALSVQQENQTAWPIQKPIQKRGLGAGNFFENMYRNSLTRKPKKPEESQNEDEDDLEGKEKAQLAMFRGYLFHLTKPSVMSASHDSDPPLGGPDVGTPHIGPFQGGAGAGSKQQVVFQLLPPISTGPPSDDLLTEVLSAGSTTALESGPPAPDTESVTSPESGPKAASGARVSDNKFAASHENSGS